MAANHHGGTERNGDVISITGSPESKKVAVSGNGGGISDQYYQIQNPYVHYTPVTKQNNSPMESALHVFNSWGNKAETMANNIWHNLKLGPSISGAACGKVNLTVKAISEGGFETIYKQTFVTHKGEILKKTFACYFSLSTGPVSGTLYLSNAHIAFCSDRPLFLTSPSSGVQSWSYYKVMLPLGKIGAINPVITRGNPPEKYIKILMIDGHDFWFMGFVHYEKAFRHLSECLSKFTVPGMAVHANRP